VGASDLFMVDRLPDRVGNQPSSCKRLLHCHMLPTPLLLQWLYKAFVQPLLYQYISTKFMVHRLQSRHTLQTLANARAQICAIVPGCFHQWPHNGVC